MPVRPVVVHGELRFVGNEDVFTVNEPELVAFPAPVVGLAGEEQGHLRIRRLERPSVTELVASRLLEEHLEHSHRMTSTGLRQPEHHAISRQRVGPARLRRVTS